MKIMTDDLETKINQQLKVIQEKTQIVISNLPEVAMKEMLDECVKLIKIVSPIGGYNNEKSSRCEFNIWLDCWQIVRTYEMALKWMKFDSEIEKYIKKIKRWLEENRVYED